MIPINRFTSKHSNSKETLMSISQLRCLTIVIQPQSYITVITFHLLTEIRVDTFLVRLKVFIHTYLLFVSITAVVITMIIQRSRRRVTLIYPLNVYYIKNEIYFAAIKIIDQDTSALKFYFQNKTISIY